MASKPRTNTLAYCEHVNYVCKIYITLDSGIQTEAGQGVQGKAGSTRKQCYKTVLWLNG